MTNENPHPEASSRLDRIRCYAHGAALTFKNAEALYDEAQLLGEAGHYARATVLHQISMEECSKIDTLGASAISILLGHEVDDAYLVRAFRNHRAKNHANAFFAKPTNEEMAAREGGNWKVASEAFKKFQERFHAEVNAVKNAGLYVDFQDGKFTAPVDKVDESTAMGFQRLNAYFLNLCDGRLRVLSRMASEPDFYADLGKGLVERLEALRAVKELDPEQILDALMDELHVELSKQDR